MAADRPEDLSHLPDDWLEAFVTLVSTDDGPDPDAKFAQEINAIYRMRDIERREGRHFTALPEDAREELANRRDPDGSKRRAAEHAVAAEALTAEIGALEADRADTEACIRDPRRAGLLVPLLQRLDKIDARLSLLRAG